MQVTVSRLESPQPSRSWDAWGQGRELGPFHLVLFLVLLEVSAQPKEELT